MGAMQDIKGKASLAAYAAATLEPMGRYYVCPSCHSGTGPHATPAFRILPDGEHWRCYSCKKGGDVFDLAGEVNHTDDKSEQLRIVSEWAGIVDGGPAPAARGPAAPRQRDEGHSEGRAAVRADIARWKAAMASPEGEPGRTYLRGRGFTDGEIAAMGFGYAADYMGHPAVIVPWAGCDWYYVARLTDTDGDGKYRKPASSGGRGVGRQPQYLPDGWRDAGTLCVVEGLLDALALEAATGGRAHAIALAGVGYAPVVSRLSAASYKGVVVVALDADARGREAQSAMVKALAAAGIAAVGADTGETGCKDACECLARDRAALAAWWGRVSASARASADGAREEAYRAALEGMRIADMASVAEAVYALDGASEPVPTGFAGLDEALDGGLRMGLATIGAISSTGKTTFVSQAADAIASSGRGVLFVSMEQSAAEVATKSLGRLMARRGYRGVSHTEQVTPSRRALWDAGKCAAYLDAASEYAETVAPRLRVMEEGGRPTADRVREAAEAMADHDGTPPVVFVDYLQLLAADDPRLSDKQATDRNVMALRQLARDLRTTVVAISSLNRSSYSGVVTMESFKESGAVEYGSDLLMGIQPYRLGEALDGAPESRRAREADRIVGETRASHERHLELAILKNRIGRIPPAGIPFTYYPASSLFVEGVREGGGD